MATCGIGGGRSCFHKRDGRAGASDDVDTQCMSPFPIKGAEGQRRVGREGVSTSLGTTCSEAAAHAVAMWDRTTTMRKLGGDLGIDLDSNSSRRASVRIRSIWGQALCG